MDATRNPFDNQDSPGKDSNAGAEPSSATGIFSTKPAPPPPTEVDAKLPALFGQRPSASPAASPYPTQPAPDPAASDSPGPGEFTRMLRALTNPEPETPAVRAPAPRPSDDLKRSFSPVSFASTPASGPPTVIEKPRPSIPPARSIPSYPEPAPTPAQPGAFTQMFSQMGPTPPTPKASSAAPPFTPQAPTPPASSGQGEFTKIFMGGTGQNEMPQQAPPQEEQPTQLGTFDRLFAGAPARPAPAAEPPRSYKPEPPAESSFHFNQPPPRAPEPSIPAQGGFTQLLRALNQEQAPKPSAPPLAPLPPAPAPAPVPTSGGFTQLLQALSATPATPPPQAPPAYPAPVAPPAAPPMVPSPMAIPPSMPPAPAPPPSSGPGEFTRIISGSALREMQGQGAPPPMPAAAPPAARPAWTPPVAPPPPAPPPAPTYAPPAFAFPPAPAPPPVAAAAPAPPPTMMQKYLPLILIVNVFLMLVIVLILIFVLKHK